MEGKTKGVVPMTGQVCVLGGAGVKLKLQGLLHGLEARVSLRGPPVRSTCVGFQAQSPGQKQCTSRWWTGG